jgi:hypothetical protein
MNLNGLMPRSMYAVDILWPKGYYNDVKNGDKMYDILKQMERTLRRDGFTMEGDLKNGFIASKNEMTVKIVVEKL